MIHNKLTHQEMFELNHKKHHQKVAVIRFVLLLLFLILWEVASRMNWIDSFFFSSPSLILQHIYESVLGGTLFIHTGITLIEIIFSFILVTVISVSVSLLLWYFDSSAEILEPFLVVLNSLPKSALAPLLIVWLGTGMKTIIIAGLSVAIFGAIINLYTGFLAVDADTLKLIETLGGTKKDAMMKVVLPSSYELLLSNMKVNIGLSLVGVIIGEFLAAKKGLGYQIIYGTQVFRLDMVITSIIILCAIAILFYKLIQSLEHYFKKKYL